MPAWCKQSQPARPTQAPGVTRPAFHLLASFRARGRRRLEPRLRGWCVHAAFAKSRARGAVGGRPSERPLSVSLEGDDIVVIGGDVIMTKKMLDISREDSATEAPQFQELISPKSDASPEPYAGRPAS